MQFVESFKSLGFIGPLPLLTPQECRQIIRHERDGARPKPVAWLKGRAASDSFYAHLAADERIVKFLRPVLGNEVVLWGVDVLRRPPGAVHPWHCDIESSAPEGGFVSVWIGIDNTNRDSALKFIAGSHKLGRTIQEEASHRGLKRGEARSTDVLGWAQMLDPEARMIAPEMQDGEAVIFDGRLWHGSHNTSASGTRTALLLQYAAADRPVRMIEGNNFEWPFRFRSEPWPPLLVVSGSGNNAVNRLVAFPGKAVAS